MNITNDHETTKAQMLDHLLEIIVVQLGDNLKVFFARVNDVGDTIAPQDIAFVGAEDILMLVDSGNGGLIPAPASLGISQLALEVSITYDVEDRHTSAMRDVREAHAILFTEISGINDYSLAKFQL